MARKEKKYHFIYKTTNVLSGKYYIGMHSTNNLDDGYMGSGNRLRLAIRKHGKENFVREIIEFVESRKELKSREAEIVNLDEIAKKECMNLKVGGDGGWPESANERFKMRFINDIELQNKFRQISSDNMKQAHKKGKIKYDNFKGKSHTEETKQKMSESSKGMGKEQSNSQYGSCWITNEVENKKIKKGDLIPDGWRLGRKMKN